MLVSVHIPKTGGSSLLHLLKRKYGWRLRRDYPDFPEPLRRRVKTFLSGPPLAVHGHIPASKYDGQYITFLRDPVERRISTYHFIHRQNEKLGYVMNADWELALSADLETYVGSRNNDLEYFLDVPPEKFVFIGEMHRFDDDVAALSEYLDMPYERVAINQAPTPTEVPAELRQSFGATNPTEIEIYDQFVRRAEELRKRH